MNVENAPGQRADFSIVNSEWNAADAQTVGLNVWEHLWLRAAVRVCEHVCESRALLARRVVFVYLHVSNARTAVFTIGDL